ncbi:MAG: DUF4825 domain-containing protein [Gracilibacteraceae bacterium]|jgi:beta-lactamase regulating signal transducer with metallopeptidase domain|nr:DUF4825 domain-containing protein [Gracilibacteraceae bacterium]
MTDVFLTVLNMSVTAAFVIAALCLARLALRKIRAPKWISYALWAVAGFNLVCPFKLESAFSLIPFNSRPIPRDIAIQAIPRVDSGISMIDDAVSSSLPAAAPGASINPLQVWTALGAYVWLFGVAVMFLYAVISYVRLIRRKDSVEAPFVYGFIKPQIHIPSGLAGEELRYVTLHEQTHIKRRDHLVKLFAFALLGLHWFNPLAWAAFALLCADMEMSCDERVLRELGMGAKADYSEALLSLSMDRRILGASPLAFGEGGVKARVKNVLNFQKPAKIVIFVAAVLAIGLAAGLTLSRADGAADPDAAPVQATISYEGKSSAIEFGNSEKIPYVERGSTISLNFRDGRPEAIRVVEIRANADGSRKYGERTDRTLDLELSGGNLVTFAVRENWADALSSNTADYKAGSSFRWYRVICGEGENAAEYGLWVRTDPAMILEGQPTIDANALSALRAPYVGDGSAVGKIVDALPPLGDELTQRFFSIGDDYGTGHAPYTLTLYYEQGGAERNITALPKNAALLFALIGNLEEVSFAFRNDPSGGELDKAAYLSKITVSKEQSGEFIESVGLTWEDFQSDFRAAAAALFTQYAPAVEPVLTDDKFSSPLLEALPLDYGKDAAIADGVYVNIHGAEIYNQNLVDMFYESVFAAEPAIMRTMEYTVEGDPIIADYWFDGAVFTVVSDTRRDKFGAGEITSATYNYLVPQDRARAHPITGETRRQYFLSNEQNIYANTDDGGAALIDGLARIPSPSDIP